MDSNSLISNDTPPPDDREALIQAAVDTVRTSTSFRDAAKQFSVPSTTISNHLHGRKPASVTHEGQQLLDNAQKATVIRARHESGYLRRYLRVHPWENPCKRITHV